ncbi:hypothetical protein AX774_g4651 [Zancudomyces culisetae]|uniref:Ribosome biogenesis protein NOP53 n=1 Tax=Zancudomyces culisetae TaxID=1213189 RepID=A0A1R1PLQ9_ZANCU|nr:hypothetical protein AX774_g4651 [Zancudomyces culisetae]|eukprot:OMH81877.1 hypothetical protein AX774_g4651 [Zancudomyces culisetae]
MENSKNNSTTVRTKRDRTKNSRKSKSAWRKNIDLNQVQSGLEQVLEEKIKGGAVIQDQANEQLFQIDTLPNAKVTVSKKHKKLKLDELLENKSKIMVPGKSTTETIPSGVKGNKVNRIERAQLMKMAGLKRKLSPLDSILAKSADIKDQRKKSKSMKKKKFYDLWSSSENNNDKLPEKNKKSSQSLIENKKLDTTAIVMPEPGMSYRPVEQDRQDMMMRVASGIQAMIDREKKSALKAGSFKGYKKDDDVRERANVIISEQFEQNDQEEEEEEKKEKEKKEEKADEEKEEKSGSEGESENDSDDTLANKDSNEKNNTINNKQLKKKLAKAQKRRQKELAKKNSQLNKTKTKQQFKNLNQLVSLVDAKLQAREESSKLLAQLNDHNAKQPKRKLGKYKIKEHYYNVNMNNDINTTTTTTTTTDSASGSVSASSSLLLNVKSSTADLLEDSFANLQRRNLIEPRVPVIPSRRYTVKYTEKWSYKDFK